MPDSLQTLPPDTWITGWLAGSASMKESCDGNAQQQAVVNGLYDAFRDLVEEHGADYGLNHDHLLHILYPSQIIYGPTTRENTDWTPGLRFGFDEQGYPARLVVTREYR